MSLADEPLPQELYFLRVDGQWPVYVETSESKAISKFKSLDLGERLGRVRIWKSSDIEAVELEVITTETFLAQKDAKSDGS